MGMAKYIGVEVQTTFLLRMGSLHLSFMDNPQGHSSVSLSHIPPFTALTRMQIPRWGCMEKMVVLLADADPPGS